jgi:hypothetical protein
LRQLHVVDCGHEERDCETLRAWVLKRFVLSVDNDSEFRSRCERIFPFFTLK